MASATDPPMYRIPFNALLFPDMSFYRTTKSIVRSSVVINNRPELSYDAIILEDWKKSSELLVSSMVRYCTKCKEGLCVLLLIVHKVGADA